MLGLNSIPRSDDNLVSEFHNLVKPFIAEQWRSVFGIWIDLAMDQIGGFTKTAFWFETTNTWDGDKAAIKFNIHYERGKEARVCFSGNVFASTMTVYAESRDYSITAYVGMDRLINLKAILVKEFKEVL